MTTDQISTPVALDHGEVPLRFGFPSGAEIGGISGGEFDDHADVASEPLMPPPASPTWPRVYPGL